MKKAIYIPLLLLIIFSGCRKPIQTSERIEYRDSISYRETVRLDTLKIPSESLYFEIPCPETGKNEGTHTSTGLRASVTAKAGSDGIVRGVVNCSGFEKVIAAKDREISRLRSESNEKSETVEVYKSRWYDIALRYIALFALAYAGLKIIFKLKFGINL